MRKLLIAGVLLIAVTVALSALAAFVFGRARDTKERFDRNQGIAQAALDESAGLETADRPRYEELLDRAQQFADYADSDYDEYTMQLDGARYFAAGAAVCLAGGVIVLVVRRRRSAEAAVAA